MKRRLHWITLSGGGLLLCVALLYCVIPWGNGGKVSPGRPASTGQREVHRGGEDLTQGNPAPMPRGDWAPVDPSPMDPSITMWQGVVALAFRDFAGAVTELRRRYPEHEIAQRLQSLLFLVHSRTLAGFAENLQFLDSPNERNAMVASVAQAWAKRDPSAILAMAKTQFTGEAKNAALSAVASAFISSGDFARADELIREMPGSARKRQSFDELAASWARHDPDAALSWAESLPETGRSDAMRKVITNANLSIDRLLELANSSTTEELKISTVQTVARRLSETNPERAMHWANELPHDYQEKVKGTIAPALARRDLGKGTAFALGIHREATRLQTMDRINADLLAKDPHDAVRWIGSLPPEVQERMAFNIAAGWYQIDAARAREWVQQLQPGTVRDRALVALSYQVAREDRAAARQLAAEILDPHSRRVVLADFE